MEKIIKKCHGLVNSKAIKVVDLVAFESKVLIVFKQMTFKNFSILQIMTTIQGVKTILVPSP